MRRAHGQISSSNSSRRRQSRQSLFGPSLVTVQASRPHRRPPSDTDSPSSPQCSSRATSLTSSKGFIFKNNILSYREQGTMTPRVMDAACSIKPVENRPPQLPNITPHRLSGPGMEGDGRNGLPPVVYDELLNADERRTLYNEGIPSAESIGSTEKHPLVEVNRRRLVPSGPERHEVASESPRASRMPSATFVAGRWLWADPAAKQEGRTARSRSRSPVYSFYPEHYIPFSQFLQSRYHTHCSCNEECGASSGEHHLAAPRARSPRSRSPRSSRSPQLPRKIITSKDIIIPVHAT